MTPSRIHEAREFLASLLDAPIRLPFDPSILPLLFSSMSESSRSSAKDLASMVARSQALAARVLAVANSACYGLLSTVTTLERAVQVLGILDLRALAIMFSLSEALPKTRLPENFPGRLLWEHQVRTARLGKYIAGTLKEKKTGLPDLPDPESVYAAGLLHDLGKIILACRRPEDWNNILSLGGCNGLVAAEAEEAYWGIDHSTIGGIILKIWNLPPILTDMVNWHHDALSSSGNKTAVRILAAANLLAETPLEDGAPLPEKALRILPESEILLPGLYAELQAIRNAKNAEFFAGV
ncbi:MAG: HDOD domain-containing protein [Deltaproteobacteria bacterium]|jgi:HD-like signal output (HDOD) protein|nr:HDOD domain-containing protein [Deltaproteobacteria bacterium]